MRRRSTGLRHPTPHRRTTGPAPPGAPAAPRCRGKRRARDQGRRAAAAKTTPGASPRSRPRALRHRRIHVQHLQPCRLQPLGHDAQHPVHQREAEGRVGAAGVEQRRAVERQRLDRLAAPAPGSACPAPSVSPTSRARRPRAASARETCAPAPRSRARPAPSRSGRNRGTRRPRGRSRWSRSNCTSFASALSFSMCCGLEFPDEGVLLQHRHQCFLRHLSPPCCSVYTDPRPLHPPRQCTASTPRLSLAPDQRDHRRRG